MSRAAQIDPTTGLAIGIGPSDILGAGSGAGASVPPTSRAPVVGVITIPKQDWEHPLLWQGDNFFYGRNGCDQNYDQAETCYQSAIGSSDSNEEKFHYCDLLISRNGDGDMKKAAEYLVELSKKQFYPNASLAAMKLCGLVIENKVLFEGLNTLESLDFAKTILENVGKSDEKNKSSCDELILRAEDAIIILAVLDPSTAIGPVAASGLDESAGRGGGSGR